MALFNITLSHLPIRLVRSLTGEDAIAVLTRQHREIKRAFVKAALPGPGRAHRFERLVHLLAVHEAGEEAHVHPLARRLLPGGARLAASRRGEEKHAKAMLVTLARLGPHAPGYTRRLIALARAVTRHAAHEERKEFPGLRTALSARRLRLLGAEMKLTQLYAPTRPRRWVNNEVANKLAAPVLGPADRLRDALGKRYAAH
jgi:hypothetical protein